MRRARKRISDFAVISDLLNRCHVGHLGTVGEDGWPMVKPVNFVFVDGRIYFHSAQEGEKLEHIRHDRRVCFEACLPLKYVAASENPCTATYLYRSVIARGRADIILDPRERLLALDALMAKYQPEGGYGSYPEEALAATAVVRIELEEIVGKEELGSGEMRDDLMRQQQGSIPSGVGG